jgi:hypothetical protein
VKRKRIVVKGWAVAQVTGHLPSKCRREYRGSVPSITKRTKKKKRRKTLKKANNKNR